MTCHPRRAKSAGFSVNILDCGLDGDGRIWADTTQTTYTGQRQTQLSRWDKSDNTRVTSAKISPIRNHQCCNRTGGISVDCYKKPKAKTRCL